MIKEIHDYIGSRLELNDFGFVPMKFIEGGNLTSFKRVGRDRIDILRFFIYNSSRGKNGVSLSFESLYGVVFPVVNKMMEMAGIDKIEECWYSERNDERGPSKLTCIKHPAFQLNLYQFPKVSENLYNSSNAFDEKVLKKECAIFREILEKHILPFYELFPSLQAVNDEIIEPYNSIKELVKFIPTLTPFKKMVIMSECNNPLYPDYLIEYEIQLKKAIDVNKEKYMPSYEFFLRLKKVLADRKEAS